MCVRLQYGPILAGKDSVLKKVKLGKDDPRDPQVGHPEADGLTWVVDPPPCEHAAGAWHDTVQTAVTITVLQSGCGLTITAPGLPWSAAAFAPFAATYSGARPFHARFGFRTHVGRRRTARSRGKWSPLYSVRLC